MNDNIDNFDLTAKNIIQKIKKIKTTHIDTNEKLKLLNQCSLDLILLKNFSRESNLFINSQRSNIEQNRSNLDEKFLSYQNFRYERDYLQREINSCKDFRTIEMEKIENDEQKPNLFHKKNNIHEINQNSLNILKNELNERILLTNELKEIKIKRKAEERKRDEQKHKLRKLPQILIQMENALKPLKSHINDMENSFLEFNNNDNNNEEKKDIISKIHAPILSPLVNNLPTPLKTLYYLFWNTAKSLYLNNLNINNFEILIEEINTKYMSPTYQCNHPNLKYTNDNDSDDDDDEDDDNSDMDNMNIDNKKKNKNNKRKRSRTNSMTENENDNLSKPLTLHLSPYQIVLKFKINDNLNIYNKKKYIENDIIFSFIEELGIITVYTPKSKFLLSNLYPNDSGNELPNLDFFFKSKLPPSPSLIAALRQLFQKFPLNILGAPYFWAQKLAGYDTISLNTNISLIESTKTILYKIYNRILSNNYIQQFISLLFKKKLISINNKLPSILNNNTNDLPSIDKIKRIYMKKKDKNPFYDNNDDNNNDEDNDKNDEIDNENNNDKNDEIDNENNNDKVELYDDNVELKLLSEISGLKDVKYNLYQENFGCNYYNIEMKKDNYILNILFELSPEYPIRAPKFILNLKNDDNINDEIKLIETFINTEYEKLMIIDNNNNNNNEDSLMKHYLLSHQLKYIQISFNNIINNKK